MVAAAGVGKEARFFVRTKSKGALLLSPYCGYESGGGRWLFAGFAGGGSRLGCGRMSDLRLLGARRIELRRDLALQGLGLLHLLRRLPEPEGLHGRPGHQPDNHDPANHVLDVIAHAQFSLTVDPPASRGSSSLGRPEFNGSFRRSCSPVSCKEIPRPGCPSNSSLFRGSLRRVEAIR